MRKSKIFAVADLQLAFDNTPLMRLLESRALALKAGKFEKARQIQEKMTKCKNDNFDELITPKLFYATFH